MYGFEWPKHLELNGVKSIKGKQKTTEQGWVPKNDIVGERDHLVTYMSKRGGPLTLRYFFFHLDPKYHHCSVNNLKIIYAVNIRYKFSDSQKKVKYNLINKRTKLVLLFLFRFNIIEYACDEPT